MFKIPDFQLNKNNQEIYKRWFRNETEASKFDRARKQAKRKNKITKNQDRHARMVRDYWLKRPTKLKRKGTRKADWIPHILEEYANIYFMQDTVFTGNLFLTQQGDRIAQIFETLDEVFMYLANIDIEQAKEIYESTGRNIFGFVEIKGIRDNKVVWDLNDYGKSIFSLQWDENNRITLWRYDNSDANPNTSL